MALIGPIQSNKTRVVAATFDWVHSVDRLKIAERLSAQRPAGLAPLSVCVQVNVSGEASKSGVAPAEVGAVARAVAALPGLRLRGLMAIPEVVAGAGPGGAAASVRCAAHAVRAAAQRRPRVDTLSVGMSDDLEAAILEGATMVRVGSAIFGRRARPELRGASAGSRQRYKL